MFFVVVAYGESTAAATAATNYTSSECSKKKKMIDRYVCFACIHYRNVMMLNNRIFRNDLYVVRLTTLFFPSLLFPLLPNVGNMLR